MLQLKGKLKRLDGGMPRHVFWEWAKDNAHRRGYAFAPLSTRSMIASAYRVKSEYESEVAATVQMLCDAASYDMLRSHDTIIQVLAHFGLTPIRGYSKFHYFVAVETDKCWLVYPTNIRHLNWQLNRRSKQP